MKETGHNTFRTSIQWSHLIPEGTGEINQKAVSFYRDYFTELLDNGIEPFVNLYHFDMPLPDGYQEKRSTLMFLMQQRALNCLEIWSKNGLLIMNQSYL